MKTTIELSDALLARIKREARENGITMRELLETAVRTWLDEKEGRQRAYVFENYPVDGNGVCEGVTEGSWEQIRAMVYEGRGG